MKSIAVYLSFLSILILVAVIAGCDHGHSHDNGYSHDPVSQEKEEMKKDKSKTHNSIN